jgi:hypothetical protein
MAGRSRHGMHLVTGDVGPLLQPITAHLSRAAEAEEVPVLRSATLRLASVLAQVTRFLEGPRGDRNPDQES